MPIYISQSGQRAKDRITQALKQETALSQRRASLQSGDDAKKKREALREAATLHNIRKGLQQPSVDPPAGYGELYYDRTTRCWKSYALNGDGKWMAWCVNVNKWLSSTEWESSMPSL